MALVAASWPLGKIGPNKGGVLPLLFRFCGPGFWMITMTLFFLASGACVLGVHGFVDSSLEFRGASGGELAVLTMNR